MTADSLTRVLQAQLTTFVREVARARRGVVRGVHHARVASRRLREGLPLLAGVVASGERKRAGRVVRRLTRALGDVRECDVTRELAETEAARHEWPVAETTRLVRQLDADRARRHRRLLEVIARESWKSVVRALRRAARAPREMVQRASMAATQRARRRARALTLDRRLVALGAVYVPDHLHAVRLAVKKLRYALEWEQNVSGRGWTRERRTLEDAQDTLGRLHDLQGLQERIHRAYRAGEQPRATLSALKHMAGDLERECRALHATVLARVPALARVAAKAVGP